MPRSRTVVVRVPRGRRSAQCRTAVAASPARRRPWPLRARRPAPAALRRARRGACACATAHAARAAPGAFGNRPAALPRPPPSVGGPSGGRGGDGRWAAAGGRESRGGPRAAPLIVRGRGTAHRPPSVTRSSALGSRGPPIGSAPAMRDFTRGGRPPTSKGGRSTRPTAPGRARGGGVEGGGPPARPPAGRTASRAPIRRR